MTLDCNKKKIVLLDDLPVVVDKLNDYSLFVVVKRRERSNLKGAITFSSVC